VLASALGADGLQVRHLYKQYGSSRALADVSFDVTPGEVHALLGVNGAGKSTVVKILSGVVEPDSGSLTVNANQVHALGSDGAFVYQDVELVPFFSVAENLALGNSMVHAHLGMMPARKKIISRMRD
jgi:ribose transport system ATP-binding protein